jgi:hypothetical protein
MQIAIAGKSDKVSLWCKVIKLNRETGAIDFWVINGAWQGKYHDGQVYIEDDTESSLPGTLVWVGERTEDYNEAIRLIQKEIDSPEYVMIQPDQYVEPKRQIKEYDDEDDIPF